MDVVRSWQFATSTGKQKRWAGQDSAPPPVLAQVQWRRLVTEESEALVVRTDQEPVTRTQAQARRWISIGQISILGLSFAPCVPITKGRYVAY